MTETADNIEPLHRPAYYGFDRVQHRNFFIGLERIRHIRPELEEMFAAHWAETETLYLDRAMKPDWEMFYWMETNRRLLLFTVRDHEDKLVGNAMFMLGHSTHIAGTLQAREDTFYLAKDCRGMGIAPKFIRYIEKCLKQLKVVYMGMSDKSPVGGKSLKPMMEGLGFEQIAVHYQKDLTKED